MIEWESYLNETLIGSIAARRLEPLRGTDRYHEYEYEVPSRKDSISSGRVRHRYDEGGWVLLLRILKDIERRGLMELLHARE